MKFRANIFLWLQIGIFILSLFTESYGPLVIALFLTIVVLMLDNLGKSIVLRELIALHSCFVCLLMPLAGYTFFTKTNPLALLWGRYMVIPQEQYFGFALPAMSGFVLALCWPLRNPACTDHGPFLRHTLARARAILHHKANTGVLLLVLGTIMFKVSDYLPASLQFAFLLFYFAGFAGLLYVYYAKSFKFRKIVLFVFVSFTLLITLNSGMFTIMAYMGLTLFSFFFLGKESKLWKKLSIFIASIFLLLIIQMVKPAYRAKTWKEDYQGNKAVLFGSLFSEKITHFSLESADLFFPVYYRTNQGYMIAFVMRRFPELYPFDNGKNIGLSLASALVPRFLWPTKPEAGGKFNMQYYVGIYLVGWSTNVGPLGEAYGSFGVKGGIIYMIFLGLFIRFAYRSVFVIAAKIPLIIFWIPVLFYQVTYSAETDTLQIFNFLLKSAFFVYLLYKITPGWFIMVARNRNRKPVSSKDLPAITSFPNKAHP
ncbi:hypothetical protein ACX0G9_09415 [Flavitalea flava]